MQSPILFTDTFQSVICTYHIIQIVRSEKFSRLQCLVEIHRKTFAVVLFMQYLLTSLTKRLLENFRGS